MRTRRRDMFFLAFMLAVCGAACWAVVRNAAAKREMLLADIAVKQKAISDVDRSSAGAEDLLHQIAALQASINSFNGRLPSQADSDNLLQRIKSLATSHGLATMGTQRLAPLPVTEYVEQPIRLSLTGDFDHFYEFLLQLEKLPGLPRVTQMRLEKSPGHDGAMHAEITLSMFLKPVATVTASTENE